MREEWTVVPAVEIDGDSDYMDGNVLAGPLREVFAVDLTDAMLRCEACTSSGPLAGLRVYAHAPGLVARCPTCLAVLLRLVREPAHVWLDLRGSTFLRIGAPAEVLRL